MKQKILLSSIMATSLVSPGSTGWAMGPADETSHRTDIVDAAIDARLANATVYTANNVAGLGEESSVSVLLVQPGEDGQKLYNVSMGNKDLEMIIRTTDKERNSSEYGNGYSDDAYFYLKFLTSSNEEKNKTYIGFTCNSSQDCITGEFFYVLIEEDNLRIEKGVYGTAESIYLPSFMLDINLALKKP